MANADKNIVITPNNGQAGEPKIEFTGNNGQTITMTVTDDGALVFTANTIELFTIAPAANGVIFSVKDESGIPSIEVDDDGTIRLAEFAGNVLVGTATDDTVNALQVDGGIAAANVTATLFTGDLVGNADTASALETTRYIILSGDASGSATFNGTSNATITVAVADDSHNHIISNVDGLQTALDAKLDSSSYTASDVLTKIKTVDGSGSGLDADTLDGQEGSYYTNATNISSGTLNSSRLYGSYNISLNSTNGQLVKKDDRIIEPNSIGSGTMQFGFTSWNNNNAPPYADYLHMRGYTEATGGYDNLIAFRKDTFGLRLWRQSFGSASAYSSYVDVWHTGNDGSGSGLDADLLDGLHYTYFANSTHTHSGVYEPADATILKDADIGVTVQAYSSVLAATTASFLTADETKLDGIEAGAQVNVATNLSTSANTTTRTVASSTGTNVVLPGANSTVAGVMTSADYSKLAGIESGATADQSASEILAALLTVDGAGSGLDADTLDGISSASFLRSDANDTASGDITFTGTNGIYFNGTNIKVNEGPGNSLRVSTNSGYLEIGPQNASWTHFYTDLSQFYFNRSVGVDGNLFPYTDSTKTLGTASYRWLSIYGDALDIAGNITVTGTVDGRDIASDGTKLDGIESGATADMSASEILTAVKTVDGSGSGLDADLLDGHDTSYFANSTHTHAGSAITSGTVAIAYLPEATSAQWRNNTADKLLSTDQTWGAMSEVTLTDGASIALDFNNGIDFTVTLAGNRTLANPTNVIVGKKGRIRVVQDATGSRTLSYGSYYKFAGGSAPTLTTTASHEDILYYDCISSTKIVITPLLDLS